MDNVEESLFFEGVKRVEYRWEQRFRGTIEQVPRISAVT